VGSAAFIAACGGDDDEPASGGGGDSGGGATTGGGGTPADSGGAQAGGQFVWQGFGDVGGSLDLIGYGDYSLRQFSGLTHEALLETVSGIPGHDGTDKGVQPLMVEAMPELSPDQLSATMKLKDIKFHDGTPVTAEDVKWSLETLAGETSAWGFVMWWLESVEASDDKTVTIKTRFPFADLPQHLALQGLGVGDIMSKAFQESPAANEKLMGSGPYLFDTYSPPTQATFKRNPDYHLTPYPYFDEITRTGDADPEKKIADVIGKNVHFSYWVDEASRDRIVAARPDLQTWKYDAAAGAISMRTDKAPWNDVRVRRALSMAIDRETIAQANTQGEGRADQYLSWTGEYWEFREPMDLGASAQYWDYNVAEAKKLMQAANVQLPIKIQIPHWNATVIGPKWVEQMTLIKTGWKNAGLVDAESIEMTHPQIASGAWIGNYDDMTWFPNVVGGQAQIGMWLTMQLSWQGRPHEAPTVNRSYVDDPELDGLLTKQLSQYDKQERISTFRQIEDILASQQYAIINITWTNNWFADPSVKNAQPGQEAYQGALPYLKYWSFDA
jgi:peptide/nickel transport system substrate-binding protein